MSSIFTGEGVLVEKPSSVMLEMMQLGGRVNFGPAQKPQV